MDFSRFDTRLLMALEAIHRLGSLTAAGEALGLSQPALSHALGRLRDIFGDPLFVRTPRGMRSTPRADELAASARRIMATLRLELGSADAFEPRSMRRTFHLAMSDIGETVFLPRLLARLRAEAPGCDVKTASLPARRLGEALDSGGVDLAIGYFPDLPGGAVAHQILFERGFLCLASASHPRLGASLSLEEFLAEPHLVVTPQGRVEEIFEVFLARENLSRRVLLAVPHMFSLPWVLRSSDLVATVPESAGRLLVAGDSGLVAYRPPLQTPRIRVAQHWSVRFQNEPAIRWLRGLVGELFLERASMQERPPRLTPAPSGSSGSRA